MALNKSAQALCTSILRKSVFDTPLELFDEAAIHAEVLEAGRRFRDGQVAAHAALLPLLGDDGPFIKEKIIEVLARLLLTILSLNV